MAPKIGQERTRLIDGLINECDIMDFKGENYSKHFKMGYIVAHYMNLESEYSWPHIDRKELIEYLKDAL